MNIKRKRPDTLPIFKNLSQTQLKRLYDFSKIYTLPSNQIFIHERKPLDFLYVILSGQVEIIKKYKNHSVKINRIKSKEILGEINYLDSSHASASVKTKKTTKLLAINIKELKKTHNQDIHQIINHYVKEIAIKRIRGNNLIRSYSSFNFKESSQLRAAMVLFMTLILYSLSFYTLLIPTTSILNQNASSTTLVTIMMLSVYSSIFYFFIKKAGFPLKDYGLTLERSKDSIKESMFYSMVFIIMITFLKWVAITFALIPNQPVIDLYGGSHINYNTTDTMEMIKITLINMVMYALFCPLQEVINRGMIQGCLDKFINYNRMQYKPWPAIILSNLLFCVGHVHYSMSTAFLVFVPGIFWGWMFSKQKNLTGVSISHIVIGIWSFFIMGYSIS